MTTAKKEIMKSGERAESRAHHNKRVRMQHGTDHTANNVASCSKPFKTQGHCLRERQRGSRAFLAATNNKHVQTMWNPKRNVSLPRRKKSCPRANVKGYENERRMAQWWTCKASRALVSWGTHRKHATQKRSFSCWKARIAHLPRHKLLSASTRSWLSMSAHQNHDTPPRRGVLSGKNRRHASQTWRFSS